MPKAATPENPDAQVIAGAGLIYVSDLDPGIHRRRLKSGFRYLLPDGRGMRDAKALERIRALAIPPAYEDVWICVDPRGHLQATGRDARGRKQYRYHRDWQRQRGAGKFDRVIAFGQALPRLRRRLRRDLAERGLPQSKVLAVIVAVMAETLIRVGNQEYARSNRSFGLTTLRNTHVAFLHDGRARLRFRGKGGLEHDVVLDDARLARLLRHVQQLPGQSLFQYVDEDSATRPIDSGMVNAYLKEAMGEDFTAKDFRTWGASFAAFQALARTTLPYRAGGAAPSERALTSLQNAVVKEVAQRLGNTPVICRKAYIDPAIFVGWRDGRVQAAAVGAIGERQWEQAALRFLREARKSSRPASPPRRRRQA